ncbi:MAG TPA: LysR family transcriptional regulator [Haliangium sp.]|nr:LysR family transcriptional regulator [Haliangium sp.]
MRDPFAGVVAFVHTARDRSFRRAAERLGVTPAAVSKAIQRLEEELGVQLFHRTTRRVSLSPEGELFLARCQEAMAQVHAGREAIAMARRDPAGELTVSLPFILGRVLVARLPRFLGRYPALRLHLRLSDRLSRLIEEGVDVAIRMGDLDDSALVARRLMHTRWATVASPAYLAQHGTPARTRDLAGHNCIKFRSPRGTEVEWSFAENRGAERVKTAGNLDLDQGELLIEAAASGLGICQALHFMVEGHVQAGKLVEILREHAAPGPTIHAVCLPGQRSSPRVRAFIDFLVDELASQDAASGVTAPTGKDAGKDAGRDVARDAARDAARKTGSKAAPKAAGKVVKATARRAR